NGSEPEPCETAVVVVVASGIVVPGEHSLTPLAGHTMISGIVVVDDSPATVVDVAPGGCVVVVSGATVVEVVVLVGATVVVVGVGATVVVVVVGATVVVVVVGATVVVVLVDVVVVDVAPLPRIGSNEIWNTTLP